MEELIIFGQESTAIEIKSTAEQIYKVKCVRYDDNFNNQIPDFSFEKTYKYIISFSNYSLRNKCINHLSSLKNFVSETVIHSSAVIDKSASIGKGCFIAAGTVISTNAVVKDHSIINIGSSIGHDSIIGNNVFILPGARVSGNVKIGNWCIIGSNSFIKQDLVIGDFCYIDAMTKIENDVTDKKMIRSIFRNQIMENILIR